MSLGNSIGSTSLLNAFFLTNSSANLLAAMTDPTGTGQLVFNTSPTFITPVLGTPTSGNLVNTTGYLVTNVSGATFAMSHRLTLTTGVPVTSSDVTAATTLYLTPYKGADIDIYSGTAWFRFKQVQLSITNATLAATTPYDVFIQYNAGTPQLSLTAWTNSTTRATALAYQDGVLVLSGTPTSRYLGTIYTDAASKFNDSLLNRAVFNYYNRVSREIQVSLSGNWSYNTSTWRQSNANSAFQVSAMCGVVEDVVSLDFIMTTIASSTTGNAGIGIGVNSTSSNSAQVTVGVQAVNSPITTNAKYVSQPSLGYNTFACLEIAGTGGTTTFFGTATLNGVPVQSSLIGTVFA